MGLRYRGGVNSGFGRGTGDVRYFVPGGGRFTAVVSKVEVTAELATWYRDQVQHGESTSHG